MSDAKLYAKIITPVETLFEGEVLHATFPGESGSFSVFPRHAPIISALKKGNIEYSVSDTKKESIAITRGFVEVRNNMITAAVEK